MKNNKIAIIGLGYVGLPLAIAFGKKFNVVGFDVKKERIKELNLKYDKNREIDKKEFFLSKKTIFTSDSSQLSSCGIFIITVPTPIKDKKRPNLKMLSDACNLVGRYIRKNSIVIIESTVYPGCTEEFCVPILEKKSKLKFNKDFFCGYSPERINPGDKKNKLENIAKITSGSNQTAANKINNIYKKIIKAGTIKVSSIKVAEAAKIIENVQRFVNISLINELALIFDKLNLSTKEVLDAAGTKWNFLKFQPGLIGGHCIAVDPYYLSYKVKQISRKSEIINTSLNLHEKLFKFICLKMTGHLKKLRGPNMKKRVLILGLTFKENCNDYRNSQSVNLVKYLRERNFIVDTYDPLIKYNDIYKEHKIKLMRRFPKKNFYDGIILAVPHQMFLKWGQKKIEGFGKENFKIIDVKSKLKKNKSIWQF